MYLFYFTSLYMQYILHWTSFLFTFCFAQPNIKSIKAASINGANVERKQAQARRYVCHIHYYILHLIHRKIVTLGRHAELSCFLGQSEWMNTLYASVLSDYLGPKINIPQPFLLSVFNSDLLWNLLIRVFKTDQLWHTASLSCQLQQDKYLFERTCTNSFQISFHGHVIHSYDVITWRFDQKCLRIHNILHSDWQYVNCDH